MAWIMVVIDNIDIIDINTALKHSTWPFIIKDKYSAHTRIIRLYWLSYWSKRFYIAFNEM